MYDYIVYTDGWCSPNPGKGAYGMIAFERETRKITESRKVFKNTTNNRMEMWGCIDFCKDLTERKKIAIYSDSKYVVNGGNHWVHGWAKKNFPDDKKNMDLWYQIFALKQKHEIKFFWVKGHSGNKLNERADYLSSHSINGEEIHIDSMYEGMKAISNIAEEFEDDDLLNHFLSI